jgi:hypothetical protein
VDGWVEEVPPCSAGQAAALHSSCNPLATQPAAVGARRCTYMQAGWWWGSRTAAVWGVDRCSWRCHHVTPRPMGAHLPLQRLQQWGLLVGCLSGGGAWQGCVGDSPPLCGSGACGVGGPPRPASCAYDVWNCSRSVCASCVAGGVCVWLWPLVVVRVNTGGGLGVPEGF